MILGIVNIVEELIWSVGVQVASDENLWHDVSVYDAETVVRKEDTTIVRRDILAFALLHLVQLE